MKTAFYKKIGLAIMLASLILTGSGSSQALTMQDLMSSSSGKVLGDTVYTRVSLVSNVSLKLGITPVDIQNGKWNYNVDWTRTANRQGSVVARRIRAWVGGTALSDPAPKVGSAQTGYALDANTQYNIEFWSKPGATGILLARKYFTTLKIPSVVISPTICEYPAPPVGCTYKQGPNYDSSTNCNMVLDCGTCGAGSVSGANCDSPAVLNISSLSPAYGPLGTQVIITGTGFTSTGNTIKMNDYTVTTTATSNGTSLTFNIPTNFSNCTSTYCTGLYAPVNPADYKITVINTNGTSNTVNFSVTGSITCPNNAMCAQLFTVTSPVGGEQWVMGTTQTISWTAPSSIKTVNLMLNYSSSCPPPIYDQATGTTIVCNAMLPAPYAIAQNVPNTGSYSWTIPTSGVLANPSYISISDAGSSGQTAKSNPITISKPTGTAPVINNINPISGAAGSQVTLTGTGFTSTGNTVTFSGNPMTDITSNGTSLTFTVPTALNPSCYYSKPQCLAPTVIMQPGIYQVTVTNANGTSNVINYTVSGSSYCPFMVDCAAPPAGMYYKTDGSCSCGVLTPIANQ